jgi:hypothetical protein
MSVVSADDSIDFGDGPTEVGDIWNDGTVVADAAVHVNAVDMACAPSSHSEKNSLKFREYAGGADCERLHCKLLTVRAPPDASVSTSMNVFLHVKRTTTSTDT